MQNHEHWRITLGICELLFNGDCGGPMFVIYLYFCLDFSMNVCSVHIKKPQNLYAIVECTYGVESIGCEILVAAGVG